MSEPRNTLENTQTGDLLYISNARTSTISRATHVTKTQVHAVSRKFRRDGSEISGDTWNRYHARPATEKDIMEHRRRMLAGDLRRVEYLDLSLDQLQRIQQIVEEGTNE
jgi:hypothetical protein